MELSKRTVVILGISSIGIILIVAAWFAWPRNSEDEKLDITGNNNKDFSLVHIEGLRAETGAHITNIKETAKRNNWITWGMIGVLCIVIMAYTGHYMMVRIP